MTILIDRATIPPVKSLIVKRPSTTHTNIPILSAKIQYKRTNDAAKLTRIMLRYIIVEKVLILILEINL